MKSRKKISLILFLIICILGIGLGYAALSSDLRIEGTSDLRKTTWDIHFDNIHETTGGVTPNSTTSINAAGDTVTFNVTLSNPGEFYEFTVDAVNAGTLDGMIESVSSTLNGGSISALPECLTYSVKYEDGKAIDVNQLLAANTSETYKVRIEFKEDITESQLPDTNQQLNLKLTVNYVQADDNATPVVPPIVGYVVSEESMYNGQTIPQGVNVRSTPEQAMADWPNISFVPGKSQPYYLKFIFNENNEIKETYIGFMVTEEMLQDNPEMTTGTYYLKGGSNNEVGLAAKPYFEEKQTTLIKAFGRENCSSQYIEISNLHYFSCSSYALFVAISDNGMVLVTGGANHGSGLPCGVDAAGCSGCAPGV